MFPPRLKLLTLLVAAGGCLSTDENASGIPVDFEFTIAGAADGWAVGAADYPVGSEAQVDLMGDQRALPADVSTEFLGLYESGTNVGSDLFVFHKRFFTAPAGTYKVSALVQFVTDAQGECTTGVGPAVVIKAGASLTEPMAIPDNQGIYRMNIDKGTQTSGGDFVQLGNMRNGLAGCASPGTFAARTTPLLSQTQQLVVDATGGFWMFIGTQSTFNGRHEIYFTHFRLVLVRQ